MTKPVIVLGYGGHAKVLMHILKLNGVAIKGIAGPAPGKGESLPVPYVGTDQDVLAMSPQDIDLVNGVGSVGKNPLRRYLYENFKQANFLFASVIHQSSVIADRHELAEGVQVMAGAVIQPGSKVGCNSIINTNATLDHDCTIGAHVHIAPGAVLAGEVCIGDSSFIGAGAVIIQNRKIGGSVLIGAGSVVINSVEDGKSVVGVPARVITK